jgi:hypothetical protein
MTNGDSDLSAYKLDGGLSVPDRDTPKSTPLNPSFYPLISSTCKRLKIVKQHEIASIVTISDVEEDELKGAREQPWEGGTSKGRERGGGGVEGEGEGHYRK